MRIRLSVILATTALVVAGSVLTACGPKEEMFSERPAPATTTTSSATPTTPTAAAAVKVFEVGNVYGIRRGAKAPTFTLDTATTITTVTDYHYVDGGGPTPGTIGLKDASGKLYGPWPTTGIDGQGGVKNAFWQATPNALLPAGTYTVVDSDPASWSTNDKAAGLGFVTVLGVYAK
jgi:hypothetical protein